MLDRKPRATSDAHKNQGSYALPAQMPLAGTQGHQALERHCSPVDSSPLPLYLGPGNARSPETDQRMQEYYYHRSEPVLLPDDMLAHVVPLSRCIQTYVVF